MGVRGPRSAAELAVVTASNDRREPLPAPDDMGEAPRCVAPDRSWRVQSALQAE